jgi:hypothetical protein
LLIPVDHRRLLRNRARCEAEEGYAAVDALVALMLIAAALAAAFPALAQAARVADSAREVRSAKAFLAHLLEASPATLQVQTGETSEFRWRVAMEPTGAERPVAICRQAAQLVHRESGRRYVAATLEACPAEEP